MLKTRLQHPEILAALAGAGHGMKVLIADLNYPFAMATPPNGKLVYLNLCPGKPTVTEVLELIAEVVPVEELEHVVPPDGSTPEIVSEFRTILGPDVPFTAHDRFAFYGAVRTAIDSRQLCLTVATGEERIYSNAFLTIGYIPP